MTSSQRPPQPCNALTLQLAIWIPALFSAVVLLVFAASRYPVPDGDAIYFLPAIQSLAARGELANRLVELGDQTDPSGAGRFLFYVPGFPLLSGSLLRMIGADSYRSALTLLAGARAASVLLFARALALMLERSRPSGGLATWLVGGLVLSNGLFLFASNGRPEILSMLILSIALLAAVAVRSGLARHLVLCACVALLFPVSLASGLIALSFYLLHQWLTLRSARRRLALLALIVLLAAVLLAGSYAAAGLPLADGLRGLALHSQLQLRRAHGGWMVFVPFWRTWILFGLLAVMSLGMQIRAALRQRPGDTPERLWLVLALAYLGCCLAVFSLRVPTIQYNFYAFLPIYQALAVQLCIASRPALSRSARPLTRATLGAAIGLALIEPAHTIMLFPYYLSSRPTYQEALAAVARLNDGRCQLAYTDGLFTLDPAHSGIQLRPGPSPRCTLALVQEVNSKDQPPRGWPLIADHSDRSPITERLRAWQLLRSPKGYSFRAYRQQPTLPKPAPIPAGPDGRGRGAP